MLEISKSSTKQAIAASNNNPLQQSDVDDQKAMVAHQNEHGAVVQAQEENPAGTVASTEKSGVSAKKIEANRRNALRSTGPRNTENSRYNAVKHGLLATGLTQLDDIDEYCDSLAALNDYYEPTGPLGRFYIERVALDMIRARRTDRLEADAITCSCPAKTADCESGPQIDPIVFKQYLSPVLDKTHRYHTAALNRIIRVQRVLDSKREDEMSLADADLCSDEAKDASSSTEPVKSVN